MITEEQINALLCETHRLFNHVYWCQVDIGDPSASSNNGLAINWTDINERNSDFLRELKNTVIGWVYSRRRQSELLNQELEERGSDLGNAISQIKELAHQKFRTIPQGQFGELLLFNTIQHFFRAPAILRKMPLSTSREMERFGVDALHYNSNNGRHNIYVGEAKCYKSEYKFKQAFTAATDSIINCFSTLDEELNLYHRDGFLDPSLQSVADSYKAGTLRNVRYSLVSIIVYQESKQLDKTDESSIFNSINTIVQERYESIRQEIYGNIDSHYLERMHFYIFPAWSLDQLLEAFVSR